MAALTSTVLQSMQVGAVFEPSADVTSMDFSPNGELLITSNSDDSLNVYDCVAGRCAHARGRFFCPARRH